MGRNPLFSLSNFPNFALDELMMMRNKLQQEEEKKWGEEILYSVFFLTRRRRGRREPGGPVEAARRCGGDRARQVNADTNRIDKTGEYCTSSSC